MAAYLATLDTVEAMQAAMFIPAHAEANNDVKALVRFNREKVLAVAQKLLALCVVPMTFDVALQAIFAQYRLEMNFEQYVLVGSTIRSYLSWLKDDGKMQVLFHDHQLLWQTL